MQGITIDPERFGRYSAILVKSKTGNSPIRCNILILFTDRLAKVINLDFTSHLRQFLRVNQLVIKGMKGAQQCSGKTA